MTDLLMTEEHGVTDGMRRNQWYYHVGPWEKIPDLLRKELFLRRLDDKES